MVVARLVWAEGASELLTSYVAEDSGPAGFYRRLGFEQTGELDANGEVIARLLRRVSPPEGLGRLALES